MKAEGVPVHTGTAKFDLSLELEEREDRLWGRIEYRTDLFGDRHHPADAGALCEAAGRGGQRSRETDLGVFL